MHKELALALANRPAAHEAHAMAPLPAYLPAGQLAQALDAEAPVDAKYIPGAHAAHEVDATAPEF